MARRSLGNLVSLITCHVLRSPSVRPSYILKQLFSRHRGQITHRHAYLVSQEASLYIICQSAIESSYFSTVRKVSWVWNTINTTYQAQHSHREIWSALALLATHQPTNVCCAHASGFYPNSWAHPFIQCLQNNSLPFFVLRKAQKFRNFEKEWLWYSQQIWKLGLRRNLKWNEILKRHKSRSRGQASPVTPW